MNLAIFLLLTLTIIFGCLLLILIRWQDFKRFKKLKMSDVDHMSGIEFEKYIGQLLQSQGFQIKFTKTSGDFGTDIIASKPNIKISVQVKRYSKPVGRAAISDAVAAKAYYGCQTAMVVTTSSFTSEAKSLAKVNHCLLVDRNTLNRWILGQKRN